MSSKNCNIQNSLLWLRPKTLSSQLCILCYPCSAWWVLKAYRFAGIQCQIIILETPCLHNFIFLKKDPVHVKLSVAWICALSALAGSADLQLRPPWVRAAALDGSCAGCRDTHTEASRQETKLCAGVSWENSCLLQCLRYLPTRNSSWRIRF